MIINALDCKMAYRKAMFEFYPNSKSFIGPKVASFEKLANLLTLHGMRPEQYIPFVFGVWDGPYAPTPSILASPIQFQHFRGMMI